MAYAIIENNIVINAVEAEEELALANGWVELQGEAGIGWSYIDGVFVDNRPKPEPEPESPPL
jgi:hypothetical protein